MLSLVAVFGTLTGLAFSLALLFLPALVAKFRHHPNTAAIFLINLFFGWTFIGWVIALIWACMRPAAAVFRAPVYPAVIGPRQYPAVANSAVSILPPTQYRRAR
jgi:hypothetical protein